MPGGVVPCLVSWHGTMVSWYGQGVDDEPAKPFQIQALPNDVRSALYAAAVEAGVTMSELAVDILTGQRPPLPRR